MAAALVLSLAAACQDGPERAARSPVHTGVVVASFDFAESRLLAEIYSEALESAGVAVRREFELGPRELVLPALRQGFVDVVPEYAGSALDAVAPRSRADRSDARAVLAALAAAVEPWGLEVLSPAEASNDNVLAVTTRFATETGIRTTSDLARLAPTLTIGGPPECPQRPRCLLGLAGVYGLRFDDFVPLPGQELVRQALRDGVIDVGVLFTTDAVLAGDEFVVLEDDRRLQPAENVVPVARRDVLDPRVTAALDAVSGRLTTSNLRFLNWRVANAGTSIATEAHAWLVRQGLVAR